MELRILKKKDGTEVLQQLVRIEGLAATYKGTAYEWQDVPTEEEE